jgi:hypothetical protein
MYKPLVCSILVGMLAAIRAPAPLVLVQTIPLPRVEGRIDHLAVDLQNDRLFVAALGNDTLEVLDLRAGAHARSVKGLHEPQGIALPPDGKIVAVANGQGGNLQLLDRADLTPVTSADLGDDPDNVRYDAGTKRLYVGYGSGAVTALDAQTGKRLGDVKLTGHPESFQLEANGPRVYVNVPSARQVAVLDRTRRLRSRCTDVVVRAGTEPPLCRGAASGLPTSGDPCVSGSIGPPAVHLRPIRSDDGQFSPGKDELARDRSLHSTSIALGGAEQWRSRLPW